MTISIAMAALALALAAPGAQAANVTLGSPLTAPIIGGTECPDFACTVAQGGLPGATVTSPVDGVVVRWRILEGKVGKNYRLRILDPRGGLSFAGVGSSEPEMPAAAGLETFEAALPIHAGQLVGLDMEPGGSVAATESPRASALFFRPPLNESSISTASISANRIFGFNAEVQPAPAIAGIDPASGSVKGGNAVIITGSDLEGATAVRFGDVPARYEIESEDQITAIAPASPGPATVPISVTTIAGTATAPASYTYVGGPDGGPSSPPIGRGKSGCVVPKLKGKKLKGSKKLLKKANCRIGKVRRKKGAAARFSRVVRQSQRPGKVLRVKARISLTLG